MNKSLNPTGSGSRNFSRKMVRKGMTMVSAIALLTASAIADPGDDIPLDIPSQKTEKALLDLAEKARVQILFVQGVAKGTTSPAVRGNLSMHEALDLILKDTGLVYEMQGNDKVRIFAKPVEKDTDLTLKPSTVKESGTPFSGAQDDLAQQDGSPSSAESELELDEVIIVTGSRIERPQYSAPNPVTVIDAEQIRRRGLTNLADAILDLPSASSSTTTVFGGSDGVRTVDLRGLSGNSGSQRTLTLVNGRRHVAGVVGTSAVNISTIPSTLVERIEVVTGGSSAVYGSEAIAGVVNVITRKDFEGLSLNAHYDFLEEGDGDNYQLSATYGRNLGDRGNFALSVQYSNSDPAYLQNREYFPDVEGIALNSDFELVFLPDVRDARLSDTGVLHLPSVLNAFGGALTTFSTMSDLFGSVTGTPGTPLQLSADGGSLTAFDPGTFVDPVLGAFTGFAVGGDGLASDEGRRELQRPSDQLIVNGLFHYEISDELNLSIEAKYVEQDVTARAVSPILSPDTGTGIPIGLDNPFLPAEATQIAAIMGQSGLVLARRFSNQDFSQFTKNETYRNVVALDGKLANDWTWEASWVYGRTSQNSIYEDVNLARLLVAANPTFGMDGNPACRADALADVLAGESALGLPAAPGCVPFNPFGNQTVLSDEQRAFIVLPRQTTNTLEENVGSLVFAGELFDMPAGPVRSAFGGEYRKTSSASSPDASAIADLGYLSPRQKDVNTGSFDVWSLFGEVNIPLVEDAPLIKHLDLDLSARVEDYSTVGNVFSWKSGATWVVNQHLAFRGGYGVSVRAPNISEQFRPTIASLSNFEDPCSFGGLTRGDNRAANCASGGVAPQLFTPFYDTLDSANPDLKEERATTYTIGAVLTPDFIPGLSIAWDWWNIDIKDAVTALNSAQTLNACYDADPSSFPVDECSRIERDAITGQLLSVESRISNISRFKTSGYDVSADYRFALADLFGSEDEFGTLSLRAGLTRLNSFYQDISGGEPGEIRGDLTHPRTVYNLSGVYTYKAFSLFLQSQYRGQQISEAVFNFPNADPVESGTTYNMSMSLKVNGNTTITAGVNNLTDKQPDPNLLLSSFAGQDALGRRLFLSVGTNF